MNSTLLINQILDRIAYAESRLEMLQRRAEAELKKDFFERDSHVARFLDKEKRAYTLMVNELNDLLVNEQ